MAGAQEAYGELLRRYQRPVLSLILRMVRDPALAEDLAQETFVKAFRKLHLYDRNRKLASWLFKVAHNTTLDHLRRRQMRTVPLEAESGDSEDTWEVLRAPEEQGPERRAARSELALALEKALGQIAVKYRAVLLLRLREGLSYQEIADATGQALGTVKIQIHRGRKQLAAQLEGMGFAPPGRWASGKTGEDGK
jgi:RNA polymerase sigma-70 factor (ECF subfamily)